MSVSGMHQEAVVVKEEPGWSLPAGSCGVSEAAARAGLYTDHEVKVELVVGPECVQPRTCINTDAVSSSDSPHRNPIHASTAYAPAVFIKEEVALDLEEEEGIKQEPSWSVGAGACGGSAAAARAGLRAAHGGEGAVVAGPESLQPRDGGYIPPMRIKEESDYAEEAGCPEEETECWKYDAERVKEEPSGSMNVAARGEEARLYDGHQVKDELVLCPERLQPDTVSGVGARSSPRPAPSPSTHTARTHTTPAHNTTRGTALSEHTSAHDKKYSCGVCLKEFKRQSTLTIHERVHTREKLYCCRVCRKEFTLRGNLKIHERVHTGDKPYSCGVCKKQFSRSQYLKIHEQGHTLDRSHICGVCKKAFKRADALKAHKLLHTGERPYFCEICTKRFTRSASLKRHILIHTGEKPHSCAVCKKEFAYSENLRKHERIHSKDKPYSCKICKKKFTESSALRVHERIHTGHKPYSCDMCGKQFNQKVNLVTHIQSHARKRSANTDA